MNPWGSVVSALNFGLWVLGSIPGLDIDVCGSSESIVSGIPSIINLSRWTEAYHITNKQIQYSYLKKRLFFLPVNIYSQLEIIWLATDVIYYVTDCKIEIASYFFNRV